MSKKKNVIILIDEPFPDKWEFMRDFRKWWNEMEKKQDKQED